MLIAKNNKRGFDANVQDQSGAPINHMTIKRCLQNRSRQIIMAFSAMKPLNCCGLESKGKDKYRCDLTAAIIPSCKANFR